MLLAPRPPACPAAPSARAPQRRRRVTPACASAAPAPPPAPSPPPQQPPPPAPRPPPLVSPGRRALVVGAAACGCGALALAAPPLPALAGDARVGAFALSEAQWRAALPGGAYRVLRQGWTEAPWSSPLGGEHRPGVFACAGCGQPLFDAAAKFESGTGWPSFGAALPGAVKEVGDMSIPFLPRAEVRCTRCEGHLGHVFDDGPPPTGLRFCMNGAALRRAGRFTPAPA